jgi:hypothetical protein
MDTNNIFYFIEDFSSEIDLFQKKIISLTPEASHALSERGLSYHILEDYYEEKNLEDEFGNSYFNEQLEWFRKFDEALRERVPICKSLGLNLVHAHRFRLKYVIDSMISSAYIFRSFLVSSEAKKIVYVKKRNDEEFCKIASLNDNSRRFLKQILLTVCLREGVAVEWVEVNKAAKKEADTSSRHALSKIKQSFKKNLKPIFFFIKYEKANRIFSFYAEYKKVSVVFLSAGHKDSDPIIKDLVTRGANVFLKVGNAYERISSVWQKSIAIGDSEPKKFDDLKRIFEEAFIQIMKEPWFFEWINTKAGGARISENLLPFLHDFISSVCPQVTLEVPVIAEWYKKHRIDFVVCRGSTHIADSSSLMAADLNERFTKKVCFQHGCVALDSPVWLMMHGEHFDYLFTPDPESHEYMEKKFNEPPYSSCRVLEYSDLLRPLPKVLKRRKFMRHRRETVFYLPSRLPVGVRLLNTQIYPANWYYHFQIALLDAMAAHSRYHFVFKYIETKGYLKDSTLSYLKRRAYSNVSFESTPFYLCADRADRIVVDRPGTTALYEAVAMEIPALALYHSRFHLKDTARRQFGDILQPFNDISGAINALNIFLNSDPKKYRVDFSLTQENAAQNLVSLKKSFDT